MSNDTLARALALSAKAGTVNVKDYGATGNGTTDDTHALISAWKAASAAGATLLYPAGTYVLSSAASYPTLSNIKHVAKGEATLKWTSTASNTASGANAFFYNCTNMTFEGITFSAPNNSTRIFQGYGTSNDMEFKFCTIKDVSGLFFDGAGDNLVFLFCDFTESSGAPYGNLAQTIGNVEGNMYVLYCRFNFTVATSNTTYISANHGAQSGSYWIIGNRFNDKNASGSSYLVDAAVDIEPTQVMKQIVIRDNILYDGKIYFSAADKINIENNDIYRTVASSVQDARSISGINNSVTPVPVSGTVTIKNNRFYDSVGAFALYYPTPVVINVPCQELRILDNKLYVNQSGANLGYGMQITPSGASNVLEIAGNLIQESKTQSSNPPIFIEGISATNYINSIDIHDNRVESTWAQFVHLAGTAATVQTLRIKDNDLSNFSGSLVNDATGSTYNNETWGPNIGVNNHYLGQPSISSGVAWKNTYGQPVRVFIGGGTVSSVAINGQSTGIASGMFTLLGDETLTITYSAAPTVTFFGM